MIKYCVRNMNNGQYLNTSGGWSKNIHAWDVRFFPTYAAAEAAFVVGIRCDVTYLSVRK